MYMKKLHKQPHSHVSVRFCNAMDKHVMLCYEKSNQNPTNKSISNKKRTNKQMKTKLQKKRQLNKQNKTKTKLNEMLNYCTNQQPNPTHSFW
jgi:hypothetical protein